MRRNPAARTLIGFILFTTAAFANDDASPLSITADAFEYREKDGVATYQGHVEAVQGTRRLNGDLLEVYRDKTGEIERIVVHGKPAKHRSLPDPEKPLVNAEANTITYNTVTKKLLLQQAARVEQGQDIYEAPLIEYDTIHKLVRSPEMNNGRTTITLKPRE